MFVLCAKASGSVGKPMVVICTTLPLRQMHPVYLIRTAAFLLTFQKADGTNPLHTQLLFTTNHKTCKKGAQAMTLLKIVLTLLLL